MIYFLAAKLTNTHNTSTCLATEQNKGCKSCWQQERGVLSMWETPRGPTNNLTSAQGAAGQRKEVQRP